MAGIEDQHYLIQLAELTCEFHDKHLWLSQCNVWQKELEPLQEMIIVFPTIKLSVCVTALSCKFTGGDLLQGNTVVIIISSSSVVIHSQMQNCMSK